VIDQDVYWQGPGPFHSGALPGGASFSFKATQKSHKTQFAGSAASSHTFSRSINAYGKNKVFFQGVASKLSALNSGAAINTHKLHSDEAVGGRSWNTDSRHTRLFGNTANFTDKYAMFRFVTGASTYDYGWLELSYTVSVAFSSPNNDPELIVVAWAYDTTANQKITAGEIPTVDSTPEPGTLESTGLAALALGAAGLRRWRKARPGA
jgi:hypothetical protein